MKKFRSSPQCTTFRTVSRASLSSKVVRATFCVALISGAVALLNNSAHAAGNDGLVITSLPVSLEVQQSCQIESLANAAHLAPTVTCQFDQAFSTTLSAENRPTRVAAGQRAGQVWTVAF